MADSPAGLGDLIGEALTCSDPLAWANGVELRGHAATSPPVLVDTAQLGRALGNLMTNAIRHTPADGFVEVIVGQEGSHGDGQRVRFVRWHPR